MRAASSDRPYPALLGRYQILAPIAAGGMATVYLARATGAGGFAREVAIKLLDPKVAAGTTGPADESLLAEARLAAQIRHPAVVPVLDAGEAPEGPFLVMEFVEGDSFANLLALARKQDDRLPPAIVLSILRDALDGLHAAHEARNESGRPLGIVHRDFSPQNILVGIDGASRLTDFGIARAIDRVEYTRTGIVRGKIGYMSPEQAQGLPLDRTTDVWAAGVVAWEAFASKRLFEGDPVPTLLRIINKVPPPLSSVLPEAPAALSEAIASALTMDPNLRCSTAGELRRRLVTACAGWAEPAPAEEVADFVRSAAAAKLLELRARAKERWLDSASDPSNIPSVGARRTRLRAWGAALAALFAIGAAIALLGARKTAEHEPPTRVMPPQVTYQPPRVVELVPSSMAAPLAASSAAERTATPRAISVRAKNALVAGSAQRKPQDLAPNPY